MQTNRKSWGRRRSSLVQVRRKRRAGCPSIFLFSFFKRFEFHLSLPYLRITGRFRGIQTTPLCFDSVSRRSRLPSLLSTPTQKAHFFTETCRTCTQQLTCTPTNPSWCGSVRLKLSRGLVSAAFLLVFLLVFLLHAVCFHEPVVELSRIPGCPGFCLTGSSALAWNQTPSMLSLHVSVFFGRRKKQTLLSS